jgi:hypothetical protein
MNAAPTPIYNYAYTAFCGKVEEQTVFIGEIEAVGPSAARARIRALHRTLLIKVPRTIRLAPPQYLRLTTEGPVRIRFHRNSKPVAEMEDVSVIRAQFPAAKFR